MTSTERPGSWLFAQDETREDWLDENGHVNVQYYFRLTSDAIFHLMDRVLTGGEPRADPLPFFSLDIRIFYRAELLAGQLVRVRVRPLSRSEKTIFLHVRILRVEDGEERLAAQLEWKGGYVDPAARRMAPLSDRARAIFDAKLREAEAALPPYASPQYATGLALPPPPDEQRIVSFEGTILPDWIDRMGNMNIEFFTLIFDRATDGFFLGLGFTTDFLRCHGWGAFAVGSHMRYVKELLLGDPFRVVSAMTSVGRKTIHYRHEIWTAGGEPALSASCDHTTVFVDWEKRRSIPIPRLFLERIEQIHGVSIPEKR